ncbi:MAG TPA: hypothetical protein VMN81_10580 [Vicinamibacterales bacterium]|nr:hypothetical protein [Vicinamibacterales bacterium]
MFRVLRVPLAAAALAAVAMAAAAVPALARQGAASKSAALAKELVDLLTKQKLTSMAARDPVERDRFIAALIYPGQLMVVTGRYTVPVLLDEKIAFGKFMDVYIELNGAAVPDSKVFIEDQFADGLSPTRKEAPFDIVVEGETTRLFDGNHRKAKMSKDEYNKAFADADEKYAKLLELLLKQAKASAKS